MSEHSPGPWKISRQPEIEIETSKGLLKGGIIIQSGSTFLAILPAGNAIDEDNAHLIEAAPGLLEACQASLGAYEALRLIGKDHPQLLKAIPGLDSCQELARDAIAKAESN